MQFCGYPLFKWDLVGCWGLIAKKNEKKNYSISLEGALRKQMSYVGGGVDW